MGGGRRGLVHGQPGPVAARAATNPLQDQITYDFNGGGRSDLDPSLPSEATDPAICGVLHR
jgi:hypothetical protein